MLLSVYRKYRAYRLKKEEVRLKDKAEKFSDLFNPTAPFTFAEFAECVEAMGVKPSDNILLRLSSQAVPYLSEGLIDFYKKSFDYVDAGGGHVMSLSYSFDRSPLMYLALDKVFDPENTPTTVGLCNEIFRRMDGGERSVHPTHSVSVYGKRSKEITAEHHLNPHTYSLQSPFAHLYKYGKGKEIIIGLNHSSTAQHFIEDKFSITGKISRPITNRMKINGNTENHLFYADNPFVKYTGYYKTDDFRSLLMEKGMLKQSVLNGISVYVYDCPKQYSDLPAIYQSDQAPFKRKYAKTLLLNQIARPIVLNMFFKNESGHLVPKGNVPEK